MLEHEGLAADATVLYKRRTWRGDLKLERQEVVGSGEDRGEWRVVLELGQTLDVSTDPVGITFRVNETSGRYLETLLPWAEFDDLPAPPDDLSDPWHDFLEPL